MAEISKPDYQFLWSSGGSIVAPSNVKIQTGWTAEVPPFQWENWSQNRQDQAIAHVLQHGISVWDALTEYHANKSYVQGSDGVIYRAKQTQTNQNPVTDAPQTYWYKAFASGTLLNVQVFVASGTLIPTVGTGYSVIEVQGGGAGGGGATVPSAGNMSLGAPGGGGAYGKGWFNAAAIGASKIVTVGAGGIGVAGAAGSAGGASSVGALISAPGGIGGSALNNQVPPQYNGNGATTSAPSGANIVGVSGTSTGLSYAQSQFFGWGGCGGDSNYGEGGGITPINTTGSNSLNYGTGGGGTAAGSGSAILTGGAGKSGVVIVWEYAL